MSESAPPTDRRLPIRNGHHKPIVSPRHGLPCAKGLRQICVLVLFSLLICTNAAHSQDATGNPEAPRETLTEAEWKRGYHGLSVLARSMEIEPLTDLERWDQVPASDSMLILLGMPSEQFSTSLANYLNRGGSILLASDDSSGSRLEPLGIRFLPGPLRFPAPNSQFDRMDDCPIIQRIQPGHPVTRDLRSLVGNRVGCLSPIRRGDLQLMGVEESSVLANLPWSRDGRSRFGREREFILATQLSSGGRLLCVADESIFSNQMLVHADNARFLQQSLEWLAENPRTQTTRKVSLVVANSQTLPPLNPADVDLILPPPDPRDVLNALRALPPDLLVDFGNNVAAIVEDEGIINDLMLQSVEKSSPRVLNTWLVVIPAVIIAIFVLWRLLFGSNTNDRERNSTSYNGEAFESDSADAAYERFLAAHELMRTFLAQRAKRIRRGQRRGRNMEEYRLPPQYERQFKKLNRQLRKFQRDFWTEKKLISIELQVSNWSEAIGVSH